MGLLMDKSIDINKTKINVLSLLSLLFPTGKILLNETIQIEDIETH